MTGELPQGWESVALAKLVTAQKGKKPAILKDKPDEGFVPYLDIYTIERNEIRRYAEVKSSKLSQNGDLYVVWDGARSGWVGGGVTGAIGSTIMSLTPLCVDSTYLKHFISSQFHTLNSNTRGTGIPHVDPEVIWNLEVPIPPLSEQKRIVAKLEKLLDRVNSCQQRLAMIPVLLKRFRQSVLAAACSGRLTTDWREENEGETSGRGFGVTPKDFDSLPETWKWERLEDSCLQLVDCPHSTPKWVAKGKICVRTTNFEPGFLDLTNIQYVSADTYAKRIERLKPQPGDILYSREGGILGIACMIPPEADICLGQRMMLLRVRTGYKAEFLMHWLNSPSIHKLVGELTGGSASPHLNVRDIKNFPIPLPPLPEQEEIVRRVESLFSLEDQIESRLAKATDQVNRLTSSILAKAFRGELVPQEPDDEPASVLLERVRQSRKPKEKKRGGRSLQEEIKQNGLLSGAVPEL